MQSQLLARSARAAIVVMAVAVVALGAPLPAARAAPPHASGLVLAEGAGLGGAPSAAVRRVQRILERRGFDLGAPGVDGRFGPLTAAAARGAGAGGRGGGGPRAAARARGGGGPRRAAPRRPPPGGRGAPRPPGRPPRPPRAPAPPPPPPPAPPPPPPPPPPPKITHH